MVRWCRVNFLSQGVLLIWLLVGQGLSVLAVGAGGGCLDIFTLIYLFSPFSPSLWETTRYGLKYCLKGPLNPKQPTNRKLLFRTNIREHAVKGNVNDTMSWEITVPFTFFLSGC